MAAENNITPSLDNIVSDNVSTETVNNTPLYDRDKALSSGTYSPLKDPKASIASEGIKDIKYNPNFDALTPFTTDINELIPHGLGRNAGTYSEGAWELAARNQNGWLMAAKSAGQLVTTFVGDIISGSGSILGFMGNPYDSFRTLIGIDDPDAYEGMWDGILGSIGKNLSDAGIAVSDWGREAMPILQTRRAQEGSGLWYRMGDTTWWASNVPTMGSAVASFIPILGQAKLVGAAGNALRKAATMNINVASKIGKVGRAAYSGLSKGVGGAANILNNRTFRLLNSTLSGTHLDTMMEAARSWDTEYEWALSMGYGEDESREYASNMAAKAYRMGFLSNVVLNLGEYSVLFNSPKLTNIGMTSGLKKATKSHVKTTLSPTISGATVPPKAPTWFGTAGKVARKTGKFIWNNTKVGLSEGLQEFNVDVAQEEAKIRAKKELGHFQFDDGTDFISTVNRVTDVYLSDGKMADSFFWGMMGGLLLHAGRSVSTKSSNKAIAKAETERIRKNLDRITQLKTDIDQLNTAIREDNDADVNGKVHDIVGKMTRDLAIDGTFNSANALLDGIAQLDEEGLSALGWNSSTQELSKIFADEFKRAKESYDFANRINFKNKDYNRTMQLMYGDALFKSNYYNRLVTNTEQDIASLEAEQRAYRIMFENLTGESYSKLKDYTYSKKKVEELNEQKKELQEQLKAINPELGSMKESKAKQKSLSNQIKKVDSQIKQIESRNFLSEGSIYDILSFYQKQVRETQTRVNALNNAISEKDNLISNLERQKQDLENNGSQSIAASIQAGIDYHKNVQEKLRKSIESLKEQLDIDTEVYNESLSHLTQEDSEKVKNIQSEYQDNDLAYQSALKEDYLANMAEAKATLDMLNNPDSRKKLVEQFEKVTETKNKLIKDQIQNAIINANDEGALNQAQSFAEEQGLTKEFSSAIKEKREELAKQKKSEEAKQKAEAEQQRKTEVKEEEANREEEARISQEKEDVNGIKYFSDEKGTINQIQDSRGKYLKAGDVVEGYEKKSKNRVATGTIQYFSLHEDGSVSVVLTNNTILSANTIGNITLVSTEQQSSLNKIAKINEVIEEIENLKKEYAKAPTEENLNNIKDALDKIYTELKLSDRANFLTELHDDNADIIEGKYEIASFYYEMLNMIMQDNSVRKLFESNDELGSLPVGDNSLETRMRRYIGIDRGASLKMLDVSIISAMEELQKRIDNFKVDEYVRTSLISRNVFTAIERFGQEESAIENASIYNTLTTLINNIISELQEGFVIRKSAPVRTSMLINSSKRMIEEARNKVQSYTEVSEQSVQNALSIIGSIESIMENFYTEQAKKLVDLQIKEFNRMREAFISLEGKQLLSKKNAELVNKIGKEITKLFNSSQSAIAVQPSSLEGLYKNIKSLFEALKLSYNDVNLIIDRNTLNEYTEDLISKEVESDSVESIKNFLLNLSFSYNSLRAANEANQVALKEGKSVLDSKHVYATSLISSISANQTDGNSLQGIFFSEEIMSSVDVNEKRKILESELTQQMEKNAYIGLNPLDAPTVELIEFLLGELDIRFGQRKGGYHFDEILGQYRDADPLRHKESLPENIMKIYNVIRTIQRIVKEEPSWFEHQLDNIKGMNDRIQNAFQRTKETMEYISEFIAPVPTIDNPQGISSKFFDKNTGRLIYNYGKEFLRVNPYQEQLINKDGINVEFSLFDSVFKTSKLFDEINDSYLQETVTYEGKRYSIEDIYNMAEELEIGKELKAEYDAKTDKVALSITYKGKKVNVGYLNSDNLYVNGVKFTKTTEEGEVYNSPYKMAGFNSIMDSLAYGKLMTHVAKIYNRYKIAKQNNNVESIEADLKQEFEKLRTNEEFVGREQYHGETVYNGLISAVNYNKENPNTENYSISEIMDFLSPIFYGMVGVQILNLEASPVYLKGVFSRRDIAISNNYERSKILKEAIKNNELESINISYLSSPSINYKVNESGITAPNLLHHELPVTEEETTNGIEIVHAREEGQYTEAAPTNLTTGEVVDFSQNPDAKIKLLNKSANTFVRLKLFGGESMVKYAPLRSSILGITRGENNAIGKNQLFVTDSIMALFTATNAVVGSKKNNYRATRNINGQTIETTTTEILNDLNDIIIVDDNAEGRITQDDNNIYFHLDNQYELGFDEKQKYADLEKKSVKDVIGGYKQRLEFRTIAPKTENSNRKITYHKLEKHTVQFADGTEKNYYSLQSCNTKTNKDGSISPTMRYYTPKGERRATKVPNWRKNQLARGEYVGFGEYVEETPEVLKDLRKRLSDLSVGLVRNIPLRQNATKTQWELNVKGTGKSIGLNTNSKPMQEYTSVAETYYDMVNNTNEAASYTSYLDYAIRSGAIYTNIAGIRNKKGKVITAFNIDSVYKASMFVNYTFKQDKKTKSPISKQTELVINSNAETNLSDRFMKYSTAEDVVINEDLNISEDNKAFLSEHLGEQLKETKVFLMNELTLPMLRDTLGKEAVNKIWKNDKTLAAYTSGMIIMKEDTMRSEQAFKREFFHEFIHHLFSNVENTTFAKEATKSLISAIKEQAETEVLNDSERKVLNQWFDKIKTGRWFNYEEFYTYALTHKDIANILNKLDYVNVDGVERNSKKTLWDKLIEILSQILGISIKNDSALQSAKDTFVKIMNDSAPLYKQEVETEIKEEAESIPESKTEAGSIIANDTTDTFSNPRLNLDPTKRGERKPRIKKSEAITDYVEEYDYKDETNLPIC